MTAVLLLPKLFADLLLYDNISLFLYFNVAASRSRVKISVTELLPQLALYNPLDFSRKYLHDTLAYLFKGCASR